MDIYYTLAGALVLGVCCLVGSVLVFLATRAGRGLRRLRSPSADVRREARDALLLGLGVAGAIGLWLGFGSFAVQSAFEPTPRSFSPPAAVDWRPSGAARGPGFDRFEAGTVTNAALSRRG